MSKDSPLLSGTTPKSADADKAEILAATFASIHHAAAQLPSGMASTVEDFKARLDAEDTEFAPLIPISPALIVDSVKKVASGKAPGGDGITVPMLKHASRKIVCQIYYIFSLSAALGYFPKAWKISRLVPIPKPGKLRELPTSYRPISLLPILGKLFERCIYTFLTEFLMAKGVIIGQQFGFRMGHSTIQQTLRIAQSVTHEISVKRAVGLILLDLPKAFDSVWHDALIYKLHSIGLLTGFIKLAQSYLADRQMYVRCNKAKSSLLPVSAGVPQALLSLIFILMTFLQRNSATSRSMRTTLPYTPPPGNSRLGLHLQSYLDEVLLFFARWKLQINTEKN